MGTATKLCRLQEEYELYRGMWDAAVQQEGPDSWSARLAQTMIEDIQEELYLLRRTLAA